MSLLGRAFKFFTMDEKRQPQVGDIYRLEQDTGNPFASTVVKVKVKDVKNGWVLYQIAPFDTGLFQNESMPVKQFQKIYR